MIKQMGLRKNLLYILSILFFFGVNIVFILYEFNKLYFSNAALIFALIIIILSLPKKVSSQDEQKTPSELIYALPKQRYEEELKMAKRVQEGLLNIDTPKIPGIKIVKKCIPAESIGGDFYSFISQDFTTISPKEKTKGIVEYYDKEDSHLGIVLGDVAGHGVSSALIMALSSGILTEMGKRFQSPEKILVQANTHISKYIENSQITHVTVFYGILNTDTFKFTFSKAGHPSPIILKKDNSTIELDTKGLFLGLFKSANLEEKEVQLENGDRLFFYTDGLTDTQSPTGELYGTERLKKIIKEYKETTIDQTLTSIFEDIDQFSNYKKASDDRSMVILEVGT